MTIKRFHTPKGLTEWLQAYLDANIMEGGSPGDAMTNRLVFIRDDIAKLFFDPRTVYESSEVVQMVGLFDHDGHDHPIIRLRFGDAWHIQFSGTRNGWIVSCHLPIKVTEEFGDLFDPDDQVETHQFHASGFNDDEIYGPYSGDPQQFTVKLASSQYKLYYFMRRIRELLNKEAASRKTSVAA